MATRASTPTNAGGFAAALARAEGVEGWLTDGQARRLWECARRLAPGATIIEIGSYRGRSAIMLACAAPEGTTVVAIDPHAGNDRGPREIRGSIDKGDADNRAFHENLDRAGVSGRVRQVRRTSGDALGAVQGAIDLLYVDGAHRYRFARDDIARWGERVAPGGSLLVHDAFSAIGVTGGLATCLLFGRRFRYVGREGSLAEYRRADLGPGEVAQNALRQAAELPWFVRNVALKVAIAAHLRPLRRLLDPHGEGWPY